MKTKLGAVERETLDLAINCYQRDVDAGVPEEHWGRFGNEKINPAEALVALLSLKSEISKLSHKEQENYEVDENVRRLILPF
jgi:hypothetical protein